MANNVLIVNSSSRPNGHTARLCNAFIEGLKEAGKQYTLYETEGKNIAPCKGCGACRHNGGTCAIRDDMDEFSELFKAADGLVLASPMYYFTFNGQMKTLIDRLYAMGVNIRFQYPSKDVAFFMTAGEALEDTFDVTDAFCDRAMDRIFKSWNEKGRIYAGGLANNRDAIEGHPAMEKARRLGIEF